MDQLRLHGLLSRENRVNTNGSKSRRFLAGASGVILLLLSACAVKKPPSTTQTVNNALPPTTKIPEQWTAQGTSAAPVETGWLKSFNDAQMEAIVAEALKNNLDLQAAATRVQVAANLVTEVHAQMMPMVGVVGAAQYLGRYNQKKSTGQRKGAFNASNLLGGVSWEVDLWAKIRSQVAAAKQGLAATELDYQVWYLVTYTLMLEKYAEQNVAIDQQLLDVTVAQFQVGNAEQQQVDLAQAQLAQSQAQLANVSNAHLQVVRALEVLLGRYPAGEIQTASALAALPPPVPAGLPVQLLERRPDVAAAEHNFDAAFHLVQSAKAAQLPSLALTGAGGYLTNEIYQALAFRPWIWTVAGNLLAPIYTGGLLQARVKTADENQKAALALYGQTILQACDDVEVTLTNERYLKDEAKDAQGALNSIQDALTLGRVKYDVGQTDLSPVLQLENVVLGTEMATTAIQYDLIANRIDLYLALGGTF
jgi:NodT family efflux transporter outer membrane factor (OMF) lipoprotein